MKYDPIKKVFGDIVSRRPFLRKIFYKLLDLMFLRSWHVRNEIRSIYRKEDNLKILDAGMGFGQYDYFLLNYFKNCTLLGLDVKKEQVEDCNFFFNHYGYKNAKFEIADLTKIDYKNEFDFILSVDVMEHIEDDRTVFNNYYNALKSGGKLLINSPSNLGGSDAHSDEDESFIEEHARNGYSKEDITEKLTKAGFKKIQIKYTYGKFGNLSWKIGIKIPIMIAGFSKILILILPIYYIFTFIPFVFLMWLDTKSSNDKGTGIMAVAEKN
jgi:SAM-dependent methyltransferase